MKKVCNTKGRWWGGSSSRKGKATDLIEIARFHSKMAELCGLLAFALPVLPVISFGVL
jgi:hypothetical protein